jgi:hypothetical protein
VPSRLNLTRTTLKPKERKLENMDFFLKFFSSLIKRFIENDPWVVIPVMFVIFSGLFISIYLGSK